MEQVYRRDAPGDGWPEGKDVFQLLWCPNVHGDPPAPHADVSPVASIRRRNSVDVTRILASPPLPVRQEDPDYGYTPVRCTRAPVPLVDFPYPQALPDGELIESVQEYVEATGEGSDVITRVAGITFGGWPTWHLTDPDEVLCLTCSAPCRLLFTVASDQTTGITVGRWGATSGSSPVQRGKATATSSTSTDVPRVGDAGTGRHRSCGSVENEHERPCPIRRPDLADAEKLVSRGFEDVDRLVEAECCQPALSAEAAAGPAAEAPERVRRCGIRHPASGIRRVPDRCGCRLSVGGGGMVA
ncbi:hypothetical protein [Streptomyces sp. NPDC059949]|uniref:hypothetical protein n=1 Tax=Streptomyces sp. NPDC059949 TaxID=3347013 RepID=UPI003652EDC7